MKFKIAAIWKIDNQSQLPPMTAQGHDRRGSDVTGMGGFVKIAFIRMTAITTNRKLYKTILNIL